MSFLSLSDVHRGFQTYQQENLEFYGEDGFFDFLDAIIAEDPGFKGVVLTGDYFDHLLSLGSKVAQGAINTIVDLAKRCKAADLYLIIIKGTEYHEAGQLAAFEELFAGEPKFFLIDSVCEIDFAGKKTLCVPEEYPTDIESFYQPFFSKKYDLILGHGFFDANCFDINDGETSVPQMPIFSSEQFCEMAPLTIFGHDHGHKVIKSKKSSGVIVYNGSFGRYCHGQEDTKGMLYVRDDNSFELIENRFARKYITIHLENYLKKSERQYLDVDISTISSELMAYRRDNGIFSLKVIFSESLLTQDEGKFNLLRERFSSTREIIIEAKKKTSLGNKIELDGTEETRELVTSKFAYLHDEGLSLPEKIKKWIDLRHPDNAIEPAEISIAILPAQKK